MTERRLVTVLFADLVGFTSIAEAQDAEETRELLARYFAVCRETIDRYGGTIEKFIGDAVMAVWGAPTSHEDDAERAVLAALDLVEVVPRLRQRHPATGALAVRAGVLTGETAVTIGAEGQGFVVGDLVNTASRLQSVALPGTVIVGEATRAAASRAVSFVPAGVPTLKGKVEPVPAYRAIGRRAPTVEEPAVDRPFVGRHAELATLRDWFERVVGSGRPASITIVGEPGIGKSALVRRCVASVSSVHPLILRGRCPAYGRGITYAAMADVLRDRFAIEIGAEPESIRSRLGGREILGLTLGLEPAEDLHPLAARNRLHDTWVALLEELSIHRPTILVIEDVHWAEEPLLELLEQCAAEVRAPLMILSTARPEFAESHPAWLAGRHHASTIWLDQLSRDESASLVASLSPGGELPLDAIVDRAEGNPLFVEELVAAVGEERAAGANAVASGRLPAPMPDSLRAVLAARFDRLDPRERSILQAAAVIGRRFRSDDVAALAGDGPVDLTALIRRDFVRRVDSGPGGAGATHVFKHALLREVAYASLSKARRARLHAAYGRMLEAAGGGRDEDAPVLAHHFAEAVRPEDAAVAWSADPATGAVLRDNARRWLERAAALSVARYAIEEAVELLERAIALEPPPAEASRLWLTTGRANVLRYDGVAFWTAMRHAIDASSDDETRGAIHAELAFETAFRWAIWKQMPARDLVDGWIDQALTLAAPDSPARVRALVASAYWHPDGSEATGAEALEIAERLGLPVLISFALDVRALAAFVAGDDRAARGWWERRTALAPAITDLDHLEDLYGSAITGHVALGEFAEARRYAALHDDVAMHLSPHHRVHAVAMHVELEELAGGWARIAELTPRAETAVAANTATPCVRNERTLLACAVAARTLGDVPAAERLEAAAEALGMEGYDAVFDPLRVRLAMLRGDEAAIRRHLPVRMPPPAKNWWRLTTQIARLDALLALGEGEAAAAEAQGLKVPGTLLEPFADGVIGVVHHDPASIDRAARRFDELGLTWHAARTRRGSTT